MKVGPQTNLEVEIGASREEVLVDGLTRTRIVQYAGASGDFNPLHTDERFATAVAGYPSVFAHGMLTMGMTGRVLSDWFGIERIATFGARFVRIVWPGDTLTARAVVTALTAYEGGRLAELSIETTNQRGEIVMTGTATARLNP